MNIHTGIPATTDAIATILLDMKEYLAGGKSPYPLREALDDALFWLLIQEAVKEPWKEIKVPKTAWSHQKSLI